MTDAVPDALAELSAMREALAALPGGGPAVHHFCGQARAAARLRQVLPPRFAEVLDQLLDRLESSALFSEDSCSFSQSDLQASLALWLDKAQARLASPSPQP